MVSSSPRGEAGSLVREDFRQDCSASHADTKAVPGSVEPCSLKAMREISYLTLHKVKVSPFKILLEGVVFSNVFLNLF